MQLTAAQIADMPVQLTRAGPSSRRRWPWTNVALAVMTVASAAAQCWPVAQSLLEFDRAAIAAGQWWRLLTGNFVHYDWYHLGANLGAFAALSWIAAARSRAVLPAVIMSALAVGAGVYLGADGTATYRGVSGVDYALLGWVLVLMAVEGRAWKTAGWTTVFAIVAVKSAYEAATGQVLLPTSAPHGVEVVGITHVVGLAVGSLGALATHGCRLSGRLAEGKKSG